MSSVCQSGMFIERRLVKGVDWDNVFCTVKGVQYEPTSIC